MQGQVFAQQQELQLNSGIHAAVSSDITLQNMENVSGKRNSEKITGMGAQGCLVLWEE